jgi:hypothetical protein
MTICPKFTQTLSNLDQDLSRQRKNKKGVKVMLKNFLQIIMIFGLIANAFAQTTSTIETKNLKVYYNGDSLGRKQFIFPAQIGKFFPKVLLVRSNKKLFSTFGEEKLSSLIKRIKFFGASQYSITKIDDRSEFPCIEFGSKRYIFAGENFDTDTDTEIFNIFLKRVNLKIESEKEAEELANLYFSVTRGYFENSGKLILSKVEDVPLSRRKSKEAETKRLKEIIVSPMSKTADGSYEVELYTWEMALGEIKKWNFKIQTNAQIEVKSEIVGKL